MDKQKVISRRNLPIRMPLVKTVVAYLLLDRLNAAGWVWGIVITLFSIYWLIFIIAIVTEQGVDMFSDDAKK